MTDAAAPRAIAWSWVEHLRSGGTTPWAEWVREPAAPADVPRGPLPGAAQLELVRRLALAYDGLPRGLPREAFSALADRPCAGPAPDAASQTCR